MRHHATLAALLAAALLVLVLNAQISEARTSKHRKRHHRTTLSTSPAASHRSSPAKHVGCKDDSDCVYGTICLAGQCLTIACKSSDTCRTIGAADKLSKKRVCKKNVCSRKKSSLAKKLTRSPGSRCKYNEECSKSEICVGGICQRKACETSEDCKKFTSFPTQCSGGVCTPHWCHTQKDCPERYGCFHDTVRKFLIQGCVNRNRKK